MWFRNLQVYRLGEGWPAEVDTLDAALAKNPLQRCGNLDMQTRGWVWPLHEGAFVHSLNRQQMFTLGVEVKLLPGAVVRQVADERAAALAAQQGYAVGRKQMRELRERVQEELLPRAFTRRRSTWIWADPVNRWLVIDASAPAKSDEVLETLKQSLDKLSITSLETQVGAGSAMTGWVASGEAPAGFTLDLDLELRAVDDSKSAVRYVKHTLEGKEIREHIATGKHVTRVGMTWNDRISFVLTDKLEIKRLAFLDILKEETEKQAENADEQFDLDFALMSGELARLLADLVQALGGEVDKK